MYNRPDIERVISQLERSTWNVDLREAKAEIDPTEWKLGFCNYEPSVYHRVEHININAATTQESASEYIRRVFGGFSDAASIPPYRPSSIDDRNYSFYLFDEEDDVNMLGMQRRAGWSRGLDAIKSGGFVITEELDHPEEKVSAFSDDVLRDFCYPE